MSIFRAMRLLESTSIRRHRVDISRGESCSAILSSGEAADALLPSRGSILSGSSVSASSANEEMPARKRFCHHHQFYGFDGASQLTMSIAAITIYDRIIYTKLSYIVGNSLEWLPSAVRLRQ